MDQAVGHYGFHSEAIHAAALALTEESELNLILDKLLLSLHELVPYDSAYVVLLEEASSLSIQAKRHAINSPAHPGKLNQLISFIQDGWIPTTAVRKSTLIQDTTHNVAWQQVPGLAAIKNWIGIPLMVAGQPIGLISLDKATANFFTEEHVQIAELMASLAAAALHTDQLKKKVQEQANRLEGRVTNREQIISQQYQRQSALAGLKIALHQPQELQTVLEKVVQAVAWLMPASDASIILWDKATDTFTTSASTVKNQASQAPMQRVRKREGATRWIIQHQQQLVVPDIQQDQFGANQMLSEYGYSSYAGVPLLISDACIGVLYALEHEKREFKDADISFLTALANQAAAAIDNVRLFQQLQTNEARLNSIISHAPVLLFALDANGIITFSKGQVLDIIGINSDSVMGKSYEDIFRDFPQLIEGTTRALAGEYLHTTVDMLENSWDIKYSPFFDEYTEVNSIIVVATDVTEIKQAEITQSRLHAQTRKILSRTEALYAVARSLVAVSDLTILLQTIVDNVTEVLPANRTAIYIIDRVSQTVEDFVIGGPGAERNHMATYEDLMSGLTGWVLRESKPALSLKGTVDFRESAKVQEKRRAHRAGSIIVVPLQYRDSQFGTISAVRLPEEADFVDEDVTLMAAMANQVAAAIQTAYLYQEVKQNVKELEDRVAERTEELTVANVRLLEIGKLRTKYMHDVSHELRTPLTTLKLYLKLLERGQPEKREQYLDVLKETYGRFENLVEGVLRLSRLHVDNSELELTAVDLIPLARNLVTTHNSQASDKNIALVFLPAGEKVVVWGHASQLEEAFACLIINAITFTTEGSVTVQVYSDPKNSRAIFEVSDTGIGISDAEAPHIFEPFYRGEQVSQSTTPGMGIGLTIVKEVVEMHRGAVFFKREPDGQTTFTISLPPHPG